MDKRSFIRAKQHKIHMERAERKHQIATLRYERQINDALMKRISALLDSLKSHAEEAAAGGRDPGEVAFRAVMESAAAMGGPEDDQPPPRPEGVHANEEPLPSYSKMMATLLDDVNKALDEKKPDDRYSAMIGEVEAHLKKVQDLQAGLIKKLDELVAEEGKKITSESIHTGFDSSFVNKSKPGQSSSAGKKKETTTTVELLNSPTVTTAEGGPSKTKTPGESGGDEDDNDGEVSASPAALEFARIPTNDLTASRNFLGQHPEILTEKETDGLLVTAFDLALQAADPKTSAKERKSLESRARQAVHQALLLQYCRALGRDGVGLFFARVTTPGHRAATVFNDDVRDTFNRVKNKAAEVKAREKEGSGEGAGVEQIQLHAVNPGTEIVIRVPPADATDDAGREARRVFESFSPEMRQAIESGSLDKVNEVLGRMKVEEAEELVGKFSEVGCDAASVLVN